MANPKSDLNEQREKAVALQRNPSDWGRRLDAFIATRPKTPVLPLKVMMREAIYGRE